MAPLSKPFKQNSRTSFTHRHNLVLPLPYHRCGQRSSSSVVSPLRSDVPDFAFRSTEKETGWFATQLQPSVHQPTLPSVRQILAADNAADFKDPSSYVGAKEDGLLGENLRTRSRSPESFWTQAVYEAPSKRTCYNGHSMGDTTRCWESAEPLGIEHPSTEATQDVCHEFGRHEQEVTQSVSDSAKYKKDLRSNLVRSIRNSSTDPYLQGNCHPLHRKSADPRVEDVVRTSGSGVKNPVPLPLSMVQLREAEPTPKIVSEGIRPGLGPVWVYENGSTCPKSVNGQPVRGEWGITRAGKPRKRLALACTACRGKKIKCHPARPRCDNCNKFDRVCRYITAARHPQMTPDLAWHEYQSQSDQPLVTVSPTESIRYSTEPRSKQQSPSFKDQVSFRDDLHSYNQAKPPDTTQGIVPGKSAAIPPPDLTQPVLSANPKKFPSEATAVYESRFTIDIATMSHYLDLFHDHVTVHQKGSPDLTAFVDLLDVKESLSMPLQILLQAMLALGTTFSTKDGHEADGKACSEAAYQDILAQARAHRNQPSEVDHARLILALYYLVAGQETKAWSLAAAGLPEINSTDAQKEAQDQDQEQHG